MVVHGAAGSVGAYAVQFARQAHLRCFVTSGSKDIGYVRSLGADRIVDFRTQRFEEVFEEADVVFDLVGGEIQHTHFRCFATVAN